jgi:hypothetical protein
LWTAQSHHSISDVHGEVWYFFTHFYSALLWITGGIKHDSLRISKDDFERFTGVVVASPPTDVGSPDQMKGLNREQSKKALKG